MPKTADRENPKNEADFRRMVMARARGLGWKVHTDPDLRFRMGDPGFPDLVLGREDYDPRIDKITGARVLIRELKMKGNYLSADQHDWKQILIRAGFDYDIWRPSDWDKIEEELG
jgi:hypothetical protein